MKFEWDPSKALRNLREHGISFEEASTVFGDWDSITIPDTEHSMGESRWVILGLSNRGTLLVVPHTERADRIRIISAWRANRRQRTRYEKDKRQR